MPVSYHLDAGFLSAADDSDEALNSRDWRPLALTMFWASVVRNLLLLEQELGMAVLSRSELQERLPTPMHQSLQSRS